MKYPSRAVVKVQTIPVNGYFSPLVNGVAVVSYAVVLRKGQRAYLRLWDNKYVQLRPSMYVQDIARDYAIQIAVENRFLYANKETTINKV